MQNQTEKTATGACPKSDASVIILSYNNYAETTGPCLASLFENGDDKHCDIIVVDNNSQDGSAEKVAGAAGDRKGVQIILNKANRGFAGGNNDGARLAVGNTLILLNSDTIVPPGALEKLSALMRTERDWAMLGPVTNQAGNEQKIHTRGKTVSAVLKEGEQWCANSRGDAFPSERLDFFCVAIRKEVYDRFGGLDERFGAGYYEDTDFSLQVKKADLTMMFTEEAFIYHQAGKSFSREGRKKVKALMRTNKKKLARKHGGFVKLLHMRQCNAAVLKAYVNQRKGLAENDAGLQYKFENRMRLAREIMPNNPFKKWRYAALLKKLNRSFSHG